MTEYNVELVRWRAGLDWRNTNANRANDARAWWVAFRDQWRTALAGNANFKVGDVFRWQGSAGFYGMGFVIRHATKGEWLFMGSGDGNNGSDASYLSNIIGATLSNYIQSDDASPGSTPAYSGLCFGYNPDPGSSTWAIGYDVDLELSGGDHTAPTQNPFSAPASFFVAAKAPHLLAFNESVCNWANETRLQMMMCDTRYNIRIDALNGASSGQHSAGTKVVTIGGEGFDSYADGGLADAGDTNQAFIGVWGIQQGPSSFSSGGGGVQIFHLALYMSAAGARVTTGTANPLNTFTLANYLAMSGKPLSRRVEVASGGTIKGDLKASVALEALPYRDGTFYLTRLHWPASSGLRLVKEHQALCLMARSDRNPFPSGLSQAELFQ